jgi:diacylglycerol kinase
VEPTTIPQSFRASWAGVVHVLRTERNARIEFAIAAAVVGVAAWVRLSPLEWAIIVLVIAAVTAGEIANTALEEVVNLLAPEYHHAAKIAKDASAGAVLILSAAAAIIGLIILGPPLLNRISQLLLAMTR